MAVNGTVLFRKHTEQPKRSIPVCAWLNTDAFHATLCEAASNQFLTAGRQG